MHRHDDIKDVRCTVSFTTKDEMSKAFGILIYDLGVCFDGVDKSTIRIPINVCKLLEERGIELKHM